eukprot:365500-Chlamydomonas_euryale.AAC.6
MVPVHQQQQLSACSRGMKKHELPRGCMARPKTGRNELPCGCMAPPKTGKHELLHGCMARPKTGEHEPPRRCMARPKTGKHELPRRCMACPKQGSMNCPAGAWHVQRQGRLLQKVSTYNCAYQTVHRFKTRFRVCFHQKSTLLHPQHRHNRASQDGRRLYVFGGNDGTHQLNDVYFLELEKLQWSLLSVHVRVFHAHRHAHTLLSLVASLCVPLGASRCVPLGASLCFFLSAPLCVPLGASRCVPLVASLCVPLRASGCVPLGASLCVPLGASLCFFLLCVPSAVLCVPLGASMFSPQLRGTCSCTGADPIDSVWPV